MSMGYLSYVDPRPAIRILTAHFFVAESDEVASM